MLRYHDGWTTPPEEVGSRFCNFVYSNHACGMRNAFFSMLTRERQVDAPGRVFNNVSSERLGARTDPDWPTKKIEALTDYRFTIAFENEEHVGYTTEKIVDAWLAGSVPIYWGNPAIEADFAPGSYLSFYEAGSLGALVREMLAVDGDPARYAEIAARNPFRTGELGEALDRYVAELTSFLERVIEDAVAHRGAPRRSFVARNSAHLRSAFVDLRKQAVRILART
jgi:hypothetical protein